MDIETPGTADSGYCLRTKVSWDIAQKHHVSVLIPSFLECFETYCPRCGLKDSTTVNLATFSDHRKLCFSTRDPSKFPNAAVIGSLTFFGNLFRSALDLLVSLHAVMHSFPAYLVW